MTWMSQHNFFTAFTGPQPAEIAARVESLTQALRDEPARRQMMVFAINEAEERLDRLHRDMRESLETELAWRAELDSLTRSAQ